MLIIGTATGTVAGTVTDKNGKKHNVKIPGLIVSGLVRRVFPPKETAEKGVNYGHRPASSSAAGEVGSAVVFPRLQQQPQKDQDVYSFDLDFSKEAAIKTTTVVTFKAR